MSTKMSTTEALPHLTDLLNAYASQCTQAGADADGPMGPASRSRAQGTRALIDAALAQQAAQAPDEVVERLRELADAADTVGVAFFDSDELLPEVEAMRQATLAARTALSQAVPQAGGLSDAARDVLAERERQVGLEGWTPEHDDGHDGGELAAAGSAYALHAADVLYPLSQGDGSFSAESPPPSWPPMWQFKPSEPRRSLIKAGALILAEIERLDRAILARAGAVEGSAK